MFLHNKLDGHAIPFMSCIRCLSLFSVLTLGIFYSTAPGGGETATAVVMTNVPTTVVPTTKMVTATTGPATVVAATTAPVSHTGGNTKPLDFLSRCADYLVPSIVDDQLFPLFIKMFILENGSRSSRNENFCACIYVSDQY